MENKTTEPSRHEIWKMFDQISPTYDRANRLMTFGLDQIWRKKLARLLPEKCNMHVLDCATGTADQIIALLSQCDRIENIIGVDLSKEMLAIADAKIRKKVYSPSISFKLASALTLPFPNDAFDCVTISFGIRNVEDVAQALREFLRVLKPSGRLLILEGSLPKNKFVRFFHLFYLRHLIPLIGGLISKNPRAYRYLNQTIETFPSGDSFCSLMKDIGFNHIKVHPVMCSAASIYQGDKNVFSED